jgi:hypothetical protein
VRFEGSAHLGRLTGSDGVSESGKGLRSRRSDSIYHDLSIICRMMLTDQKRRLSYLPERAIKASELRAGEPAALGRRE